MKKVITSLLAFSSLLLFTACSKKVTTEDLKANDWLVETINENKDDENKDDDTDLILSFSDNLVSFSFDTSSTKTTSSDDLEALGEEFAKGLVDQMEFKVEYTLDNNVMTLKDEENKDDINKYTVSREDKNIVLTPEKSNKSDDEEKLVLKPYKK